VVWRAPGIYSVNALLVNHTVRQYKLLLSRDSLYCFNDLPALTSVSCKKLGHFEKEGLLVKCGTAECGK